MGVQETFEKAQRLFVDGKYDESIGGFTKALEEGHDPGICFLSRGAAYLKIEELDKAIEDFTRAIEKNPEKAHGYYYRGVANMLKEKYVQSIPDFTKAVDLNPKHRAAIFARGVSFVNLGRNEEGVEDIKTAMVHAESAVQGFADAYGWRTQLDKVMAVLEGEKRADAIQLSDEEFENLKKLLLPEKQQEQ